MAAPVLLPGLPGAKIDDLGASEAYAPSPRPQAPRSRRLRDRVERRLRARILTPLDAHVGGAVRRAVNARRVYQPIFVAGAMGGGTTLLALSLWQRFEVAAAIRESVHQISRRSFLWGPPAHDFGSVREYEASLGPCEDWSAEQGRDDLLRMYRSYAWGPSNVVIDKGPNANLVRSGFLARCFPDATFLLIFRDPVATIEGFRRKWRAFGNDTLDESIRFYESVHESFLESMWEFPERVVAIRYEKLVEKHDELLDTLGRSLGLVPARGRRRLERRANQRGCGIRNVEHGTIGIVPDANRAAYERMATSEITRIQDRLGALHARLNLMSI